MSQQDSHGQQNNRHDETVRTQIQTRTAFGNAFHKYTFNVTWHPEGRTMVEARRGMTATQMSTARDDHGTTGTRDASGRPRKKRANQPTCSMLCHGDMTTPTDASYLHDGALLDSGSCRPTHTNRAGWRDQGHLRHSLVHVEWGDPNTSVLDAN